MREIKYRFWMTKLNEYFSWERIIRHCPEQLYDYLSETRESVLVREQYTGMKDKNGKEIYVGDIVQVQHPFGQREYTGEVIFEDYGFNIKGFYFTHFDYPSEAFSEGTKYMQVIGNIHEREED